MTRHIKRGGKVWINVFPDKPVTQKPAETRMGSGKGNPERWVAVVKPGRILFELVVPRPGDGPGGARARHPEAADQGPVRHPRGGALMAKHERRTREPRRRRARSTQLAETKDELFNLRFQHATGQLDNTRRARQLRKDVARINTELRAREIAAAEALETRGRTPDGRRRPTTRRQPPARSARASSSSNDDGQDRRRRRHRPRPPPAVRQDRAAHQAALRARRDQRRQASATASASWRPARCRS